MKKRRWLLALGPILLLAAAFGIYVSNYYRADETALAALVSDEAVQVSEEDYGWFFDGPSGDTALIFYPGGKVEATAYAPFLHRLAAQGMDVMLVKMPFRLAVFGMNRADAVRAAYDYDSWYLGGHSLGGAMAASYAAKRGEELEGLVLCAAYPTAQLDDGLVEIQIYGSEDRVLNRDRLLDGRQYAPEHSYAFELAGGNHAQFGNYGPQEGDGQARISADEQQAEAAAAILRIVRDAA